MRLYLHQNSLSCYYLWSVMTRNRIKSLNRVEVKFKVIHPKDKTPKRSEVKDLLVGALKAQKDRTVIEYLKPEFGIPETPGYAKIYKTKEDAQNTEPEHILKRNNLFEKKKEAGDKEESK